MKNHFEKGRGGPRIIGAGLYAWLYNDKATKGSQGVILYKIEKGVVADGRLIPRKTHEFRDMESALELFRELRHTIQKLAKMGREISSWPDMVL